VLSESETVSATMGELAASACAELFDAYGVKLERSPAVWNESEERRLCGVIGFVGRRVRGTCLLAANYEPLEESCPPEGRVRDWIGELANQLLGRLKSKLLTRGLEVALTTPIVIAGVKLEPLPRGNLEPIVFRATKGNVLVWVEVEAEAGLEIGAESVARVGGEGDILLF
jgi:CheY-specific phosphatase CheX